MDERKQDVIFGSMMVIIPIAFTICSLFLDFRLIDLIYLIGVILIVLNYAITYRKKYR